MLDDSERAAKQLETSGEATPVKEGVMLVFNKFQNILQSKGLKPMEAMGEEFNPDLHEAVTEIPAPTEELKGKVIDVLQKAITSTTKSSATPAWLWVNDVVTAVLPVHSIFIACSAGMGFSRL